MWEEWLQRILSAHGPEDYAVRRLRRQQTLPTDLPADEVEADPVATAPAPCDTAL
jgi:hypothetical protein